MKKNPRFKVVLYRNGKRLKTFNTFSTNPEAIRYYKEKIRENQVFFEKEIDWKNKPIEYEIAIIGRVGRKLDFVKDEFDVATEIGMRGDTEYFIKEIDVYYVEERFKHYNRGDMVEFPDLIRRTILNNKNIKVIYCINNKLVVIDDEKDKVNLFILKQKSDCFRLSNTIRSFCINNGVSHVLFFNDNYDTTELFDRLVATLGVTRRFLSKISTR